MEEEKGEGGGGAGRLGVEIQEGIRKIIKKEERILEP